MTRHSTDRTNEESRQAYEAMNLRKRKVHRMTRNVAEAFVLREGTDCEDSEPAGAMATRPTFDATPL
jgi:hypothetical protein